MTYARGLFKDRDTKLFPRYSHWCVATGKKPIGRTKFVEAFTNAANRHLLPAPDAERIERSKTKYNGNYPILGIRLVPWSDTEFYTEENEEEDDLGTNKKVHKLKKKMGSIMNSLIDYVLSEYRPFSK